MAKFKITWASGVEEVVEQSDCDTLEQFLNTRFGAGHTVDSLAEVQVKVEAVVPSAPAAEPVIRTVKKK